MMLSYNYVAEYRYVSHPWKRKKNGKRMSCLEHVRVWLLNVGEIPQGHIIHHINGNKYDNRIENLQCLNRNEHALIHNK